MVISQKKTGTEVISFNDVVHAGAQAVPVARQGMQMAGQPGAADLERLEKYIVLADKGISLLGRAEAIIGPIIARRAMMPDTGGDGQGTPITRYGTDDGSRINKDPPGPGPAPVPAQVAESPPPAPVQEAPVSPLKIASALRMIDNQAPGITAIQIAELIEKNPDAVGRLMQAALKDGA